MDLHGFPVTRAFSVTELHTMIISRKETDFYFSGEAHDFWEFVYVDEGTVGVTEDNRIYELSKGQIIFHKPMEFHRIWSAKGSAPTPIIVSFYTDNPQCLSALGDGVFTLDIKKIDELHEICDAAKTHLQDAPRPDPLAVQAVICRLELFLTELLRDVTPSPASDLSRSAQHYRKIIKTMESHVCEALSAREIAALSGLGVSNLNKIFKKYAGVGVMHYFNHLKIIRAMKLLETDMTISEVSDALGFSNPGYFLEVFRRCSGKTPSAYRREKCVKKNL